MPRKKKAPKKMSDKEFRRRLKIGMEKAGIEYVTMREAIKRGMVYGHTIKTHGLTEEERSLAGFLETKSYADEVRAADGRVLSLDELFF